MEERQWNNKHFAALCPT